MIGAKLFAGLRKTANALRESLGDLGSILTSSTLSREQKQQLEEALILADVHIDLAEKISDNYARKRAKFKEMSHDDLLSLLAEEIQALIHKNTHHDMLPNNDDGDMRISLFVGVNGSGKTTSIGKLAYKAVAQGDNVMLAAGDTFRAAAVSQLEQWAQKAKAQFYSKDSGADPASLVYEAIEAAKAQNIKRLMIDTAGRLQNREDLMRELEKINRVIVKQIGKAADDVILVLDAQNGQNAMQQFKAFKDILPITALIMTKLDGTAKGGALLNILCQQSDVKIMALGVGESPDDLISFDAGQYAYALLGIEK